MNEKGRLLASAPYMHPVSPEQEAYVDVEREDLIKMRWQKNPGLPQDPIVAYEIMVKPAFGYETEDRARKIQQFRTKHEEYPIEKIGGGGIFLYCVLTGYFGRKARAGLTISMARN